MAAIQLNVSVEIGLLKSVKKTWQLNRNLMMYIVLFMSRLVYHAMNDLCSCLVTEK